jgi:hypothetical protein
MVDDGSCDCCDGTDETLGACPFTCLMEGEGVVEQLRAHVKEYSAALEQRVAYVEYAQARKEHWEAMWPNMPHQLEILWSHLRRTLGRIISFRVGGMQD